MTSIKQIQWVNIIPKNAFDPKNMDGQSFKSCWLMPYYEEWDMPSGKPDDIVVKVDDLLTDDTIKSRIRNTLSHLHNS